MATTTRTPTERDALKMVRRIQAIRRGRCRFCGMWITPGSGGHTTLDRLASGRPMCHGQPKGPYRVGIGITKNGLRSDTYPPTADEKRRYAGVIEDLTAEIKRERKGFLSREVPA
jgi:hypothetical protein